MAGRRVLITGVANAFATRLAHLLAADAGVERVVGVDPRPVAPELVDDIRARLQEKVYDTLVNRKGAS